MKVNLEEIFYTIGVYECEITALATVTPLHENKKKAEIMLKTLDSLKRRLERVYPEYNEEKHNDND